MLVVIANDLPPAVRGRLKLWFVEPRPNVFVSGIKDSVAQKVVDYLYQYCPPPLCQTSCRPPEKVIYQK
ncbi:MAG: type I-E CRISPR-associated endoribonuclease Cas2e, partial [Methylobacter sp.]